MRQEHSPSPTTLHLNVALMSCDSEATLEETLLMLRGLPLHIKRVGPAAIAFPVEEMPLVRQALESRQCFPRMVGQEVQAKEETPP